MAKAKQLDALEDGGAGVGITTDKKLISLGDKFVEVRDSKAELATELTGIETKIIDRMRELKLRNFRFSDQLVTIKPGAEHIKIKTVKVEQE